MTPQTVNRLTAVLATGTFLVLSVLLASFSSHQSRDTLLQRPSTFFTDPSGARALFLVVKQFLPATEQWRRPLNLLPLPGALDAPGTVVMAGPTRPLGANEAEHLHRWLDMGGHLIVLTANGWPLRQRIATDELDSKDEPADDEGHGSGGTFLARYAQGLKWTKAAGVSTGRASGPSVPKGEIVLSWRRSFAATAGAKIIALVDGAPLAVEIPVGKGRITAIADPTVASNGLLRRSDNAVWLVSLAAGWGGKVLFDEYHHGFGQKRGTGELTRAFFMTPWGWSVLQVVFAGCLYIFVYRRRFGRIKELPSPNRASPLELVHARAGVLQVAAAQGLAADLIVQHLCQSLGKAHGKTIDSAVLGRELETLAKSHGAAAPLTALQALFAKVKAGARLNDREFIELGRTAGEIIKGQKP
jgi:hypothetical protein